MRTAMINNLINLCTAQHPDLPHIHKYMQFHFWLVLMGFGGRIKGDRCPVRMCNGHTQTIFRDFEKFDYRIDFTKKDWVMQILHKETGEVIAVL